MERAQREETEPERTAASPPATAPEAPDLVHNVLALQRSAGNRAVAGLLNGRALARDPAPPTEEKPLTSKVGNEYEFKLEHKGERTSWSVRFIVSKAQTSPLKASGDDLKGQLGATKMTRTKEAGKKAANSMALALGKLDLSIAEPWPGISINADLKALEAKVEKGQVDVNVFKVGVAVNGTLSKRLQGTALGDVVMSSELGALILEGATIKVQGKFEVNIDPSDLARLARMAKLNGKIAAETAKGLKAKRALDALNADQKRLKQHLKRGSKLKAAARQKIKKRMASNAAKIAEATSRVKKSKVAAEALEATYKAASKGLKSKAGRLVGGAIAKIGGKLLLRLVPGLNIALLVVDIFTVGSALYKLFTGKAKLGFGGGEGEAGKGGEGGTGSEGKTGGKEGTGGTGGTGGATTGTGETEGDVELGPEIELEPESSGPPPPKLHVGTLRVLEGLATPDGEIKISSEDLEDLNNLLPSDLSDAEAKKIAESYKAANANSGDPYAGLAAAIDAARTGRAGKSTTTATDASGTTTLSDPEKEPTPHDVPDKDGKAVKPKADGGKDGEGKDGKGGKGGGEAEGAKKGKKGSGDGEGLRQSPSASHDLEFPAASEPAAENVSSFGFQVIGGYDPTAKLAKGSRVAITIQFERGGRTFKPTFVIVVDSHVDSGDKIVTVGRNAQRWRIKGTSLEMPADQPVRLETTRTAKKKPKKK